MGVANGLLTRGEDEIPPQHIEEVVVVETRPGRGGGGSGISIPDHPDDDRKGIDIQGIIDVNTTPDYGGPGGGGGSQVVHRDPTIKVPDGQCVIGSIAAALQAKYGFNDATAISMATKALNDAGIDTTTWIDGGMTINTEKISQALRSVGFNVVKPSGGAYTSNQISSHFTNKGFGIGHISGSPAHNVFLVGYVQQTNTYTYYDAVKGGYGSRVGMSGIWLFFN